MKIGILTLPLHNNYGGILQCYALQTVLENMGHEVVVLNRRSSRVSSKLLLLRCGSLVKCIFRRYILGYKHIAVMSPWSEHYVIDRRDADARPDCREMNTWIRKYIHLSRSIRTTQALKKMIVTKHLEGVVVGSDQVWREEYAPCITDFFLGGLPPDILNLRVVAYAASFGTTDVSITAESLPACVALSDRFKAISTREQSGVEIMKNIFRKEATLVLDPTLLLSAEQYLTVSDKVSAVTGGLTCYILDHTEEKQLMIKFLSGNGTVPVNLLNLNPRQANGYVGKMLSVEYWLSSISKADFVLTDSFHGCVFAIIFKKPFVAIANKERGAERFYSLLSCLGLHNRWVVSYEQLIEAREDWQRPIDYVAVNERLKKLQDKSMFFLKNALS